MLTGTNLKHAKAHNLRTVLEAIRLYGPVSRVEIARRTGLTTQTVSNITKQLIRGSMILDGERVQAARGAPSTLLTLNPDGAFSIGLDLDKDHLVGVLIDFVGNVRQRVASELNFPSPDEAMDLLKATAAELIAREAIGSERIRGVGVGLPGPLGISKGSRSMDLVRPKAFPGWEAVPVVDILSERLSLPIVLENNATAAAVGERWYGGGRHVASFFYVYFGAGLGGGLVINGQPFEGRTGNAGELGWLPSSAHVNGNLLPHRPHVGARFNLPRLYEHLQAFGTPAHRPSDLAALLRENNRCLLDWLDAGAQGLAPAIIAIEYLIDPGAIFFGGRLPDVLIEALLHRLEQILPSVRIDARNDAPRLIMATAGADAAALGVATLPLFASFAPSSRIGAQAMIGSI